MIEVYWACLLGGIIVSLLTFLLGDVFGHGHGGVDAGSGLDHGGLHFGELFHPVVLVGTITTFGGAGIILDKLVGQDGWPEAALAALIALLVSTGLYFLYVKPMRNRENSIGYSMAELPGRVGIVSTAIPGRGCGEVIITIAGTNTCQIASSFDGVAIAEGEQIVVVEVRDHTLYVTPLDNNRQILVEGAVPGT
jgi:membrane protein implicated in regulation of membrane protease activity